MCPATLAGQPAPGGHGSAHKEPCRHEAHTKGPARHDEPDGAVHSLEVGPPALGLPTMPCSTNLSMRHVLWQDNIMLCENLPLKHMLMCLSLFTT